MKRYALVGGNHVAQSKSPALFHTLYDLLGEHCQYDTLPCLPSNLSSNYIRELLRQYDGINITMPFKSKILTYADQHDSSVDLLQSANVLCLQDNRVYAYNTDYLGFKRSMDRMFSGSLAGKQILVLGAGGVVPSIVYVLERMGAKVVIACRDVYKGYTRIKHMHNSKSCIVPFHEVRGCFTCVINAAPVALQSLMHSSVNWFADGCVYYDLSYGVVAQLNRVYATECGARQVYDGVAMLVYQACAAFSVWNNKSVPDTIVGEVIASIQRAVAV